MHSQTSSPHRWIGMKIAEFFDPSVWTMERKMSAAAYASGAVTGIAAWTVNEIAAIGGLLLAGMTFLVNWYYRHKHYKLSEKGKKDAHDRTMDE